MLVIANQKGGVGKTTTAVTLAVCFARAGISTALLDVDPQGNASSALLGGPAEVAARTEYRSGSDPFPVPVPTRVQGLTLIPSGPNLRIWDASQRLSALETVISKLHEQLPAAEVLFVDCPPSLGTLVQTCLRLANMVVAPVQCEYFALEGLQQLVQSLHEIHPDPNTRPELLFLLTMHDPSQQLCNEVASEVRNHFPDRTFRIMIPRDITLSEASSLSTSTIEYDPTSVGSRSYIEIAREIMYDRSKAV